MKRTSVAQLAREAEIELDEALILLWDAGFADLKDPTDLLRRGDANRARRVLGLATRRELGSRDYWEREFAMSPGEFESFLQSLGVVRPFDGRRLRAKAIHRLAAERRSRTPAVVEAVQLPPATVAAPEDTFEWEIIGHEANLTYLTTEHVVAIHAELVADFASTGDPLEPPGVRSISLVESAVFRQRTGIGDRLKYPTVEMTAAALLHALVHDHPFHNGNKRTAIVAMLVFLDENGMMLTCDEDEMFRLVLQLAQHALIRDAMRDLPDREMFAVAQWIRTHARRSEKGDRAVSWRRLRRILTDRGCSFEFPAQGNRINILRQIQGRPRWFGGSRNETLKTQTHYAGEGREVDKTSINRIRKELRLDDENGVDSAAFYDDAPTTASQFIVRYRKTLRRLARL